MNEATLTSTESQKSMSGSQTFYLLTGVMVMLAFLGGLTGCSGFFALRPVATETATPTNTPLPTPRVDVTPEDDRPHLRVVNASLRVPVADVYLNDRLYFKSAYYSFISTYLPIERKKYLLKIKPADVVDTGSIIEREWEFKDDRQYTMVLVSKSNGIDEPWVFEDNVKGKLTPGKGRVRLVHASLDMPALEICLNEQCEVLAFKQVDDYMQLDEGVYALTLRVAGNVAPPFVSLPATIEAGQVYTIFIMDPQQGEIQPRVILHRDSL
jgi:hypothetical protein